jgi:hypothetical protein
MPRRIRELIVPLSACVIAGCILAPSLAHALPNCPPGQHWVQLGPKKWGCGWTSWWDNNWASRPKPPVKRENVYR